MITEIPYGVDVDDVVTRLRHRARRTGLRRHADYLPGQHSDVAPPESVPVREVRDESTPRHGVRVVVPLRAGFDAVEARSWLLATPGLTKIITSQLPAPIENLILDWDAGDGSGLDGLSALLARDAR